MTLRNGLKRIGSLLLAVVLLVSLFPAMTPHAHAAEADTAKFTVNGTEYTGLQAAIDAANGKGTIVLTHDGTIYGNYEIPKGVTLLIPRDITVGGKGASPEVVYNVYDTPKAAYTLTMAPGASITVNGSLEVAAQISAKGTGTGSYNETPTGPHGLIWMESGSQITLNDGANLYCWGFISGAGSVNANSGSAVYECFQLRNWRGGNGTRNMVPRSVHWAGKDNGSHFVFPVSQYYVQSIESKMTLKYGAEEKVLLVANASNSAHSSMMTFIGKSNALFELTEDSYVIKEYKSNEDRMIYKIHGDASINKVVLKIKVSIFSLEVPSDSFTLPINNMDIRVAEGTLTLVNDTCLLPDTKITIAPGAALNVQKNLYVYDEADWADYAAQGARMVPIGYTVASHAARSNNTLVDAAIEVNGTLNVNGALYTTTNGASITGGEGGKIVFVKAPVATATTYQATQSNTDVTFHNIPVTSAKLKNDVKGAADYTETTGATAGTTYTSAHGLWHKGTVDCVATEAKAPTCTETGNNAYWTCNTCKKVYAYNDADKAFQETTVADETIKALGHDYDLTKMTWEWAAGYKSATAKIPCAREGCGHIEEVTATITGKTTQEATCVQDEMTVYTAKATFQDKEFTKTTETVKTKDAFGHKLTHHEAKAPTCMAAGNLEYWDCSVCKLKFEDKDGKKILEDPAVLLDADKHEWNEWKSKDGQEHTRTCKLNPAHTETEAHKFGAWETDAAATCGTAGTKHRVCEDCGYVENGVIEATGNHSWSSEWTTSNDKHWHVCTTCGAKNGETEHTPGTAVEENRVDSTCSATGSYDEAVYCTECKAELSRENKTIAKKAHTRGEAAVEVTKKPTCTHTGLQNEVVRCTVCDEVVETHNAVVIPVEPTNHTYGEEPIWQWAEDYTSVNAVFICTECSHEETVAGTITSETIEATCETPGSITYTAKATFDGKEYTDDRIVSLPSHVYDTDHVKFDWTETPDNYMAAATFTCASCGRTETVPTIIEKTELVNAESCVKPGHQTYTATAWMNDVAYTDTRTETLTLPHNVNHHEKVAPGCETTGMAQYWECGVCGAKWRDEALTNPIENTETLVLAATGHDWGEWFVTEATCTENGSRIRYCKNDPMNHSQAEVLKATGHDMERYDKVDSTCEYTGVETHYACSKCHKVFRDSEGKEPTNMTKLTIAKKPHTSDEGTVTSPAFCTLEGEKIFKCTVCGDVIRKEIIPAAGHTYGAPEWVWTEDEETGEWSATVSFNCTECNEETEDHTMTPDVTITVTQDVPTCDGSGKTVYTATTGFQGKTYEDTNNTYIDELGHVYDSEHVEWTWDEEHLSATAVFTCTVCDHELVLTAEGEDITSAVTKAASCIEEGVRTFTATVWIGEHPYTATETETIAMTEHELTHTAEKPAACETAGNDEYWTCGLCHQVFSDEGATVIEKEDTVRPAIGHHYPEVGVVIAQPTCTGNGIMSFACENGCGKSYTRTIEKIDHVLRDVAATDATCTMPGNIAYVECESCHKCFNNREDMVEIETTVIEATGHSYGAPEFTWRENTLGGMTATAVFTCNTCGTALAPMNAEISVETTPATEFNAGVRSYTATVTYRNVTYTDKYTVELPALGHRLVFVPAVVATCTTNGNIAHWACACGAVFTDAQGTQEVTTEAVIIPATGHDYEAVWTWNNDHTRASVALTCRNDGSHTVTGNAVVTSEVTRVPSYTDTGITVYTAAYTVDGETYTDIQTVELPRLSLPTPVIPSQPTQDIGDEEVPLASVLPFDDVAETDWFYDAVKYVYENELMSGTSDNTFDPYMDTTRGMIVTILYRVAEGNVTAEEAFDDVNTTTWYSEAVTWGTKNDVVAGYGDGLFGPNDDITREQLVAILWRYSGKPAAKSAALPFSDADQVSDYAREAMQWALEQGIIHGKSETILDPRGHATRAETAAILSRYLKLTEAEK